MVADTKIAVHNLEVSYGNVAAIRGLNLAVGAHEILGVIGPANSGKTSFLRTLNRLSELNSAFRMAGNILLDDCDIYKRMTAAKLRQRIGMVFAVPTSLPETIFENIAHGLRLKGVRNKSQLEAAVERALKSAYLWDEVKDRLRQPAMQLSGGQQQRLCLARTLAIEPEVILFDEPCSGLDPISTGKIEETMLELKTKYTLILVTNNTKQAARVSDRVAFFLMGELVELDQTDIIFTAPHDQRTNDYVSGRFG